MAVVFKSYEIVLIRVFLHAEFISAPKTEVKSMVFEKYAKKKKKRGGGEREREREREKG